MQDASPQQLTIGTVDETAGSCEPVGVVARIGRRPGLADDRAEQATDRHAGAGVDLPLAPSIKTAIMRSLTHEQRLLLVLWYVEAMAPSEIAAVMGMAETRVHQVHDSIVALLRSEAMRLDRGAA
jgi:DNA-directed RNA polymerase specialized sigma24 family protein